MSPRLSALCIFGFLGFLTLSAAGQVFSTTDTTVPWNAAPTAQAPADLTGDGTNDVLMTDLGVSPLTLSYVSPLQPQVLHPLVDVTTLSSDPQAGLAFPRLADFDDDGDVDVLFFVATPAVFGFAYDGYILFQQGGGAFSAPSPIPTLNHALGHDASLDVGDFDGDGRPDIGMAGELGTSAFDEVRFHLNQVGGWVAAPPIPSPTTPLNARAGDFDGDGVDDLLADTVIAMGSAGGSYVLQLLSPGAQSLGVLQLRAFADLNGDGAMDVLAVEAPTLGVYSASMVFGGSTPFATAIPLPLPASPSPTAFPVLSPMNGDADGHTDILVGWSDSTGPLGATADFELMRNRGGALFGPVSITAWGPWAGASILGELVIGDFDGDGDDDAFHSDRFGTGGSGPRTTSLVRNDALYGPGCAGSPGMPPAFTVSAAFPGNPAFALGITGARPQSWAILSVAAAPMPLSTCGLLLDPASLTPVSFLWTGVLGEATAHGTIPAGPALVGASLRAQWAVIDPGGAFPALGLNFALTPGRTITVF